MLNKLKIGIWLLSLIAGIMAVFALWYSFYDLRVAQVDAVGFLALACALWYGQARFL